MRWIALISLFFVYSKAFAQSSSLEGSVSSLTAALLKKDTVELKQLLHEKVSYGHSNGWIETRQEVLNDLYNGKLVYNSIHEKLIAIETDGNTAAVRTEADVDVTVSGTRIQLKLHIFQAWIKDKKGWRLLGRQSTKVS
jgi:hypothetical protein